MKYCLKKLDQYGIWGTCNDWFKNYLHNRSSVCKLNTIENKTVKSDIYNISYGTAQGSCLGPLLFILFTNDIHLLPTYSRIILFADDTTMFCQHNNLQFLKYMLEHDMTMLVDWFKANQLSLNVDKMVLIKFWSNNIPFNIKVEDRLIINSKYAKFLGLTIDKNLTQNEHVNILDNKLLSNKRLLLNARNLLPSKVLQHIYYAHVYSHLIYGLSVWGSMTSNKNKNNIYKLQTDCVKVFAKKT